MHQKHGQAIDQLPLLAPAHALDFLGDVLDIRFGQAASTQQIGLFVRPGVKILIVKLLITHALL
jgi:hypothetical protein